MVQIVTNFASTPNHCPWNGVSCTLSDGSEPEMSNHKILRFSFGSRPKRIQENGYGGGGGRGGETLVVCSCWFNGGSLVVEKKQELKATVMRTLTAVVHHDRGSRCLDIIDATSSSSYHGFLPVLVRTCIQSLTDSRHADFPTNYATAVFSFLYHMAR